jgi:predicted DNA-binding mobile mystery protein A
VIELIQVSKKFKSAAELPKWLLHGLSIQKQIRLIRNALGMTQKQLAARIKKKQHAIAQIESREDADIRLSTVREIAQGLNCELLLLLVPREEILRAVEARSLNEARRVVATSAANMALEGQKPSHEAIRREIEEMKRQIMEKHRSGLWEQKK